MALTRAQVDTRLATLWTKLQTRQEAFFASHGRYWQGRFISGSAGLNDAPEDCFDGVRSEPDQDGKLTLIKTPHTWTYLGFDALDIPADLQFELAVSPYESPTGHGYEATVRVFDGTNWWTRSKGAGPEAVERTKAWAKE